MKIRIGFVSNSSSSSFMGGIGIIVDFEKFNSWIESLNGLEKWEKPHIIDITDFKNNYYYIEQNRDCYKLVMPVNYEPTVELLKSDLKKHPINLPDNIVAKKLLENKEVSNIVAFVMGNDEGDSAFYNENKDYLDYDIDLEYFNESQKRVYNEFSEENGLACIDKTFGAGRNG